MQKSSVGGLLQPHKSQDVFIRGCDHGASVLDGDP